MQLHALGTTGLTVTALGLGMASLGRPGYINLGHAADLQHTYDIAAMQRHSHTVIDRAWAAGVRYFDAARSYGRAEQFLGSWLRERQIAPADVTIGSKWGYIYTANWQIEAEAHEIKAHELPVFQQQWQETQEQLGGYLRLYQVHSATLESGILDNQPVLAALAALRRGGVAIGLSLSGPRQADTLRRAQAIRIDGARLFDCVQATWNLLEPSASAALAEAHADGMGVIIKEAVANGRLTDRNSEPGFAAQAALLDQQARRLGATRDALALAAALAQPWADVVLSGATTVAQIESNLAALAVAWDAEAQAALDALAEPPESYWATRKALPWN